MAETKRAAAKASLKVTAPLVVAMFDGGVVRHLAQGDVVPANITQDSLEHLRSLGFVAEQD